MNIALMFDIESAMSHIRLSMQKILIAAVAAAVITMPTVSSAQACGTVFGNLVANCSFENPNIAGGAAYPAAPLNNWTANPAGVVERWTNVFDGFAAKDGISHVELKVDRGTTLSQYLSVVAGTQYTLRFSAAHRVKGQNFSQIDAFFGGVSVLSTGQMTQGFVWNDFQTTFIAGSNGGTLEFRSAGSHPTYGDHLDNVSVFATREPIVVPEPSSLALLLVGAVTAAGAARARRRI